MAPKTVQILYNCFYTEDKVYEPHDVVTIHPTEWHILPLEQTTPDQKDEVFHVILGTLRRLSQEDINVAGHMYWIFPLTQSPPLWAMRYQDLYVKHYVFRSRHMNLWFSVPVRIIPIKGAKQLSADNIQVCVKHTWKPLVTWLLEHQRKYQLVGKHGIQAQQVWWRNTGKPFQLMSLPLEVREQVFQHALGGNIFIKKDVATNLVKIRGAVWRFRLCDPWQFDELLRLESLNRPDVANYALLHVSKQVCEETSKACWEGTIKHFVCPQEVHRVLINPQIGVNPQIGPQYNWLTSIQISFTLGEFGNFFGIHKDIRDCLTFDPTGAPAQIIKDIHTLREIELFFGHNEDEQYNSFEACMKMSVDLIALGAFSYFKHIPRVNLVGFVKTTIRNKWKYIYQQAYRGYPKIDWDEECMRLAQQPFIELCQCFCVASCMRFLKPGHFRYDLERRDFDYDDSYAQYPHIPDKDFLEKNQPKLDPFNFWKSRLVKF